MMRRIVREAAKALGYAVAGVLLAVVAAAVAYLEARPDLDVWHTTALDEEFRAGRDEVDFTGYLALEERLFAELDREVFASVAAPDHRLINRFHRGSLSDAARWPRDWNRTVVLDRPAPRAGVLLLHGMSDSPYSLRNLAASLHERGAAVILLRLPGHGTAPSGLTRIQWEDLAAAVRLAMRELGRRAGDAPLYIVGYSAGGALAIEYALGVLDGEDLPALEGIVLVSPAIGVARVAALAVWQSRIGWLLGLDKLEWNSIQPEYDPFKYGSFAINAGHQVYRLTREISARLDRLGRAGRLGDMPPVLAFQSVVDATVSTPALIGGLMARLPAGGHELVLFDLNRRAEVGPVLASDPAPLLAMLLADRSADYVLDLVTNATPDSAAVELRTRRPGVPEVIRAPLELAWPANVFSVSHVALPFPADDPLYGAGDGREATHIALGNLALRGERGVLQVPAAEMLRQRWNPFYPYLEQRVLGFMGLVQDEAMAATAPGGQAGQP